MLSFFSRKLTSPARGGYRYAETLLDWIANRKWYYLNKEDLKMICLCTDEWIINVDIVFLLTAPLICCCSSLLKGFSLFNYIKCSIVKETQIWQWASCGSSVFTAASQLIKLGEKKQMWESSAVITHKKEFLSPSAHSYFATKQYRGTSEQCLSFILRW